jgi:ketosteroid isomerase-like protein
MRFLKCWFFVSVALLVAGCSPSVFDPQVEGIKLLQRDAEWADTVSAGRDIEKTVSYWSEDALIIPQGQPVVQGREEIRRFVEKNFHTPGFHIHWKSEKPIFSPDGKLAYLRSVTTTSVLGPNGALMTFPSRGMTVWRLDADGQWRCVVDIWNDPPASSARDN